MGDRTSAFGEPGTAPARALPAERDIEPPGPEEIAISHEEAARVRLAVAGLPVDQRAAIEAVVFEGRSVAEVAASLGVAGCTT